MPKPNSVVRIASLAFVLLAITGALALAAPRAGAQPKPDGELSLEGHMKKVNRAFKALSKQIADPSKNESSLDLVQTIEIHFVAAKVKVPDLAKSAPEAQRAALVKSFRSEAIKAIVTILELEQQILAGDNAKAKETIEKIKAIEKKGHEMFQVEEHDEE